MQVVYIYLVAVTGNILMKYQDVSCSDKYKMLLLSCQSVCIHVKSQEQKKKFTLNLIFRNGNTFTVFYGLGKFGQGVWIFYTKVS